MTKNVCDKKGHVRQYSRQDTVKEGVLYRRALYRRAMYRRRALHSRGHCTGGHCTGGGTVHPGGIVHVQKRRGGGQGRAGERREGQGRARERRAGQGRAGWGRAGQGREPRSGGGLYLYITLAASLAASIYFSIR